MNNKEILHRISEEIKKRNTFLLTCHTNIDGDALGSLLSLGSLLEKAGKTVTMFYPDPVPENLSFLPAEKLTGQLSNVMYDCIILLECVTNARIPGKIIPSEKASFVINLDHHPDNTIVSDLAYIDSSASALAEIVYELAKISGLEIEKPQADMLYAAILSDSGCFRHSGTSFTTFTTAAELLKKGADFSFIAKKLYFEKPIVRVRFAGYLMTVMNQEMEGLLYWFYITDQLMKDHKITSKYTNNIIEDLNIVEGCKVFVIFNEIDEGIKVSLRSSDKKISVREFAARYGGGGHDGAAGCTLSDCAEEKVKYFVDELIVFIKEKLGLNSLL